MTTEAKCSCQHCGGHIAFPSEAAGQIKYICLVLFFVFAVAGCKPKEKEQVIANKVVESEQALITGQIFIVTKGGENVVLGDVKVALLDADQTGTYFNSKALEWSNALAAARLKVDQATRNYDALYKDDLAKFAAAKKYHENAMATANLDSYNGRSDYEQASDWSKKVQGEIRDLHKLKKSSPEKKQFDDAIEAQADLWDQINWPSADHFCPRIQITTTDSEGRFTFIVPASSANLNLMLFAKAERQLSDDERENWSRMVNATLNGRKTAELYWWMVNVNLNGRKTAEFVLSNDNKSSSGGWNWFNDKLVLKDEDFSPMQKYMINYEVNMDTAKEDRDFQDWEENIDAGK